MTRTITMAQLRDIAGILGLTITDAPAAPVAAPAKAAPVAAPKPDLPVQRASGDLRVMLDDGTPAILSLYAFVAPKRPVGHPQRGKGKFHGNLLRSGEDTVSVELGGGQVERMKAGERVCAWDAGNAEKVFLRGVAR